LPRAGEPPFGYPDENGSTQTDTNLPNPEEDEPPPITSDEMSRRSGDAIPTVTDTDAVGMGSSSESGRRFSKRVRIVLHKGVNDDNEAADDESNSSERADDDTDSEYEDLIHGTARRAIGKEALEVKSWTEVRKQLDDVLKQEKVKRQLPFNQV
jgi:hypothetical protein